jgi:hypothetical protein
MLLKKRFVYVCKRRAESESRASDQGQSAKLLIHKNVSGAATRNSSETSIKHKMLRIEPRVAFINGVLLANRVLIFRFQLLAVYVLLVHNCGECRIYALDCSQRQSTLDCRYLTRRCPFFKKYFFEN